MVVIQSLWVGDKLSLMEYASIQSFLDLGYEFHLYVYDEVLNIPPNATIRDANTIIPFNELFNEHDSILPFSDLFRFKMLYLCGGIWVDLDVICLKNFNELLVDKDILFSSERTMKNGAYKSQSDSNPSINFIYSRRNKEDIFNELYESLLSKKGKMRNHNEGMLVIKNWFKKNPLCPYLLEPSFVNNIDWWHAKEFYCDLEFKTKWGVEPNLPLLGGYMIHCWRNKFKELKKKSKKYECLDFNNPIVGSLYDKLTEKYNMDCSFNYLI